MTSKPLQPCWTQQCGVSAPSSARARRPPQVNHGPDAVGRNLLRYLAQGATLVSGPVGEPVLLAFAEQRLFAVIVLTMRDNRVFKIEASVDPTAAARP